jgi:rhodanese-related sulfurtransferase
MLAVILTLISGCAASTTSSSPASTAHTIPAVVVKNLTVAQTYDLIQQNKGNDKFVILDVRTPDEYASGHIAGSILIDFNAANFKDEVNKLDKDLTYLIYCRSGNRSASAAKVMVENGFKDVYNMTGGINEWQAAGYPVVK